uniref:inositol 1,4,5-trisphosphate receptor-interacting protein n=1 Tax=Semicossyphus pulcher TaxID=241346 RepID=UPI0037E9386B
MQDTLLRVFVVAVGLLTCPRDDPGVHEWDDMTPVGLHKLEKSLLREGDKLDHKMATVNEEMTHTDSRGPPHNIQNIPKEDNQSEHHITEDPTSVLEDVTAPKTSQLDMKTEQVEDIHTDASFRDPSQPQGKQERPEEEDVFSSNEQESPLSHLHTETSENESSDAIADWERDYLWFIWNTFSIFSMIRFFRKYLGKFYGIKREESGLFPLLDTDTLQLFHSKYVKDLSDKKWKEEFLEGFANDLLEAMRTACDKNGGMVIEDFQMVDVCNIIVPFSPPHPCSFQCLLWNNQASDQLSDMQVCGQIKLVEIQNGCPCQSPDADDDMVCLLHGDTEKVKMDIKDVCDGLLCMKNSPFLSQSLVTRWFQSTIKQAWGQISHKYEFELNIRYLDAPGALVVRFRSGKKISFSMNPVVKFNTDTHFFITPCSTTNLDTFWTLSLTKYEDCFLENISKHLPENSCHIQTLDIASFIHRRQTAVSGSSALKDFHFKTALMHLLLTTEPLQWKPSYVADRLQDLLAFMKRSLEKKLLNHTLIGNPLTRRVIELPAEFNQARTVNLFHPLVVHDCIYRNAVVHFKEMLRNAHMLIHDYVDQSIDNAKC